MSAGSSIDAVVDQPPPDPHDEPAQRGLRLPVDPVVVRSRSAARSGAPYVEQRLELRRARPDRRRGGPRRGRPAGRPRRPGAAAPRPRRRSCRRVGEALRELGQEEAGLLGPRGQRRDRRTLWPRWPCAARNACERTARTVARLGQRGERPPTVHAGLAQRARRPRASPASAGQRLEPALDLLQLVDAATDQPAAPRPALRRRWRTHTGRPGRRGPGTARGWRRNGSPRQRPIRAQTSSHVSASSGSGMVSTGRSATQA